MDLLFFLLSCFCFKVKKEPLQRNKGPKSKQANGGWFVPRTWGYPHVGEVPKHLEMSWEVVPGGASCSSFSPGDFLPCCRQRALGCSLWHSHWIYRTVKGEDWKDFALMGAPENCFGSQPFQNLVSSPEIPPLAGPPPEQIKLLQRW